MNRPRFAQRLRSPHSSPRVDDAIFVTLTPHQFGGYVVGTKPEHGHVTLEGFATASDLRELAAKFYKAAAALTGESWP